MPDAIDPNDFPASSTREMALHDPNMMFAFNQEVLVKGHLLAVADFDPVNMLVLIEQTPTEMQPLRLVTWTYNKKTGGFGSGNYFNAMNADEIDQKRYAAWKDFAERLQRRVDALAY